MKISNTVHSAFSLFFLLSLSARLIQAETVEVAGYSFSSPSNWISSVPTSKMRKAQFKVPGEKGKDAEVAFFYFGGGGAGGVKANVDRWMSQFEDAKGIEVKNTTIGDTLVTYAQAHGTFLSGRAFGPKTPKPNYALLAAIISGKNGAIFIKMTGPKETVEAQVSNIKKMVLNSLDK
jgi:hypothetical protein